ncbi:hypothetical protein DFJ74DRAFT_710522 [Hyaloraphidium curvatum]|nr:hypothetical protein DFJ74DRAFT_710522 [Hyaloraphidium curvatum]
MGPAFSDRAWLALFPSAASPAPSLAPGPPPADPAAALRVSDPLPRSALLRGLPVAPLRLLTRLQLAVGPYARLARLNYSLVLAGQAAAVAVVFVVNAAAARFATRDLVVGAVCVLVEIGFVALATFVGPRMNAAFSHSAKLARDPDASIHPFAVFARWRQLVASAGGGDTGLLEHDPADPRCPCSDGACAGGLPGTAALYLALELVTRWAVAYAILVFLFWTPVVTLDGIGYSWWSALILLVYLAHYAVVQFCNTAARLTGNAAALELSLRLHNRAMRMCLADLLMRLDAGVAAGQKGEQDAPPPPQSPTDEEYVRLYHFLSDAWRTRFPVFLLTPLFLVATVLVPALCAFASAASGSCIPAFYLSVMFYALNLLVIDLANASAANAQITVVTDLLREARREVRLLLLRASSAPNPACAALEANAAVLSSFLEGEACKVRFLGFKVDYAATRTVLVTVLTIAVGLWSVLRPSGVRVVMDFAC